MSADARTDIAELITYFKGDVAGLSTAAEEAKRITQQAAQQMNEAVRSVGNLGNLGQQFQNLGSTISSSFQQGIPAINATGGAISNLAATHAELLARLKTVEGELRSETSTLGQLQAATQEYGGSQKALADAMDQSRNKAAGLVAEQAQLKNALSQTNAALRQTQQQTTETGSAFDGLKTKISNLSQGMIMGGTVAAGLGAGFLALVHAGAELQTSLVHVAGNTSMSAAEFDNLQASTIRLGLTVPASMDSIGRAYMQAANFGFHFAEANVVVEAAMKSAVATGADAEQTVRALAITMHQFAIPASEAAQTMDVLHLAAARGGQTLEQFTAVTGRVFSVARAMGVSLVDASAALSALTSAGLTAAQSATLLQGAIVKIANPANNAREEIAKLSKATGIDLVGDFSKAGLSAKGLQGVLDDIAKAVGNDTAEIFKLVPAMRGGIGVIILTTSAAKDYQDRLTELSDVMAGKLKPTQQDFERVMQTVGAQAKILGNSFEALGLQLVTALGPSLTSGLETLNSVLPQIILFIGQLPPVLIGAAAAFMTAVAAVGATSVALGALVFLLGGPVSIAVLGLSIAIGALAAVFVLEWGRITQVGGVSAKAVSFNFIDIAGKAGALADAFSILARIAVAAFDIIVSGAILMGQGVKSALGSIVEAGTAAMALARGDFVGFAAALAGLNQQSFDAAQAMHNSLKGLLGRLAGDMADIGAHASGQYAKSFAKGAMDAGLQFAQASKAQEKLVEESGLRLVNAYVTGAARGKPISAALWHSMSDEARASFTKTAQDWVTQNSALDEAMDQAATARNAKASKAAKEAAKIAEEALKAQLDGVNDWLKAIGSKTVISEDIWKRLLSPDTKAALVKGSEAFRAIQDVITKGQAETQAKIIQGFAGEKQVIDVSVENWQKYGDAIRKIQEQKGVDIRIVALEISDAMLKAAEQYDFTAQAVESASNAWVKGLSKISIEAPPAVSALQKLQAALRDIKEQMAENPDFQKLKLDEELTREFDNVVRALEEEGKRMNLTQEETNQHILEGFQRFAEKLHGTAADAAKGYVDNFIRNMYKLPGALDEIFNKLAPQFKKQISGVFEVLNNIPGQFGDTLRKITNTITTWINQIDGILKGLHKIFQSIPDGLSGVLSQVIGIFRKTSDGVTGELEKMNKTTQDTINQASTGAATVSSSWIKAGDGVKTAAGAAAGALAAFSASMAVTAATGSKTAGIITGGITSALTGFIASLTLGGPAGAIIGGVSFLGSILGSLFGGKSALQKAQEAAALQKAKDDIKLSMQAVEKGAQEVVQSAIKSFNDALAFFEQLDSFTAPRKELFRKFFAAMSRLMDYFVELAGKWSSDSIKKAKELGEGMIPVMEAVGKGLEVLEGLNKFVPVAEGTVDEFAANLQTLIEKLGGVFEQIPKELIKHAKKLGKNLETVANILGPLLDGMVQLVDFRPATQAMVDTFATSLRMLISRLGALAEEMDFAMVKEAGRFSDRAKASVDIIAAGVAAFTALTSIADVPAAAFDIFFRGMKEAITRMQEIAGEISTEGLAKAQLISEKAIAIFSAIKAAIEVMSSAQGSAAVPDFTGLKEFMRGAIQAVIDIAQDFSDEAVGAAAQFGNAASDVVKFFGEAGGTLKNLDNVFATGADFGAIKVSTKEMIQIVIDLAKEMGTEGVAAAAGFATASNVVVGFMNNTANAFKALRDAGSVTIQMVLDITGGFKLLIERMGYMAHDLGPDGIAEAVKLAGQLNLILAAITNTATTMTAIANAKWPEQGAWDSFIDSLNRMVNALETSLASITHGQELAAQIRDGALEIADSIAEASHALGQASGSFSAELTGGTLAGTPAAPLGGAGIPAAPLGASSVGPQQTTVSVQVSGSVYGDELEDIVVRALQRSGRRGRLTGLLAPA